MFRRPTFIVFECPNGSGKSACAAQLAERIGATFMTTPSPVYGATATTCQAAWLMRNPSSSDDGACGAAGLTQPAG